MTVSSTTRPPSLTRLRTSFNPSARHLHRTTSDPLQDALKGVLVLPGTPHLPIGMRTGRQEHPPDSETAASGHRFGWLEAAALTFVVVTRDFRREPLAVAVGFEPTVGFHPHTLSRRAP